MKNIFFLYILFFTQFAISQNSIFEVVSDARSLGMGESFIANTNYIAPSEYNPAVLSGTNNISLYYNHTNYTYLENYFDANLYSAGISGKTSFGWFAFLYKKYNRERTYLIIPDEVLINGFEKSNEEVYTVSYANKLHKSLTFGINIKAYKYKHESPFLTPQPETNTPILFDLGLLYNIPGILYNKIIKDNINLGAAFQNFGTDLKEKMYGQEFTRIMPRYFIIGFSYEIDISNADKANIFKFVFSGEYKNLLNNYKNYNHLSYYDNYFTDSQRDYWGIGFEATFYDILSLRLGGKAYPYENYHGRKGNLTMRYGFGLNLPFSLIGVDYPFSVFFDYALIPILYASDNGNAGKKNLNSFNLGLVWNR